jgi:hypothetical protein
VTLQCIRRLRHQRPDCQVSVEVEKPGRDGLEELAAEADVVFYSKTWAQVSRANLPPTMPRRKTVLAEKLIMVELQDKGYKSARECLAAQSHVVRRA